MCLLERFPHIPIHRHVGLMCRNTPHPPDKLTIDYPKSHVWAPVPCHLLNDLLKLHSLTFSPLVYHAKALLPAAWSTLFHTKLISLHPSQPCLVFLYLAPLHFQIIYPFCYSFTIHLLTWLNHLSTHFSIADRSLCDSTLYIISSFLILSLIFTPRVLLEHLISITSSLLFSLIFKPRVSALYNTVGTTIVSYITLFTFIPRHPTF